MYPASHTVQPDTLHRSVVNAQAPRAYMSLPDRSTPPGPHLKSVLRPPFVVCPHPTILPPPP
eukprot:9156557-Pyramimonas_sp.AAC.1